MTMIDHQTIMIDVDEYQITDNLRLYAADTPLDVARITDICLSQSYNFDKARNFVAPLGATQKDGIYKLWQNEQSTFARKLTKTEPDKAVRIIQLDELQGLDATDQRLFWSQLEKILDAVGHPTDYRFRFDLAANPIKMEELIEELGGIHTVLCGIGLTGHVGYNERGSDFNAPTRRVLLHRSSKEVLADDFGGIENTPTEADTLGLGILSTAQSTFAQATGLTKAPILQKALNGPITTEVPITYLRTLKGKQRAIIIADKDALSQTDLSPFRHSKDSWGWHA